MSWSFGRENQDVPSAARQAGNSGQDLYGISASGCDCRHCVRIADSHPEEFFAHYHKRSNVESTVMMIKTTFRDHVRSKTDMAMKNEVLCKVVCHNICCVISAIHELGIEPAFSSSTVGLRGSSPN